MKNNGFVPYNKMSKAAQRELNNARRSNWGSVSPITRRVESGKAYNRAKAKREANG